MLSRSFSFFVILQLLMDATELARWTRFASRGGIGKCTAVTDCVAEEPGDLMFLTDDEITVLMQLPDQEGVYLVRVLTLLFLS